MSVTWGLYVTWGMYGCYVGTVWVRFEVTERQRALQNYFILPIDLNNSRRAGSGHQQNIIRYSLEVRETRCSGF
jgi:hypothetical protein